MADTRSQPFYDAERGHLSSAGDRDIIPRRLVYAVFFAKNLLQNRFGGGHDIQVGIQLAAEAFNVQQRFLLAKE